MTHAELLRSHADAALREGGMYYSGEYLSRIATVAESLEAENAKLRDVASMMASHYLPNDLRMPLDKWHKRDEQIRDMLTELGIEVKE